MPGWFERDGAGRRLERYPFFGSVPFRLPLLTADAAPRRPASTENAIYTSNVPIDPSMVKTGGL